MTKYPLKDTIPFGIVRGGIMWLNVFYPWASSAAARTAKFTAEKRLGIRREMLLYHMKAGLDFVHAARRCMAEAAVTQGLAKQSEVAGELVTYDDLAARLKVPVVMIERLAKKAMLGDEIVRTITERKEARKRKRKKTSSENE